MLTRNDRQEALCRAYVQAIAARCGLGSSTPRPDYGVDLSLHHITIRGKRRVESGYRLDIQAKSTVQASRDETHLSYDLDAKSYDDLRLAARPRILVVLLLPKKEEEWSAQTENESILRHCVYWLSLQGRPGTKNRRKVRLLLPRTNVFSVEGLLAILGRIKRGEGREQHGSLG